MPRPQKRRRIGWKPHYNEFGPKGVGNVGFIELSLAEYETIRLIDKEGMTQEECAKSMEVARTTVQGIYREARKKIASALIDGLTLVVEGTDYQKNKSL